MDCDGSLVIVDHFFRLWIRNLQSGAGLFE